MTGKRPAAKPPTRRPMALADRRLLERLRRLCLAMPEAIEKVSHGEPTWFAGKGGVFATFDDHHHRAEHVSVWLPLPLGAAETLIDLEPGRYFRPPYVGGRGWIGVVLDGRPDWGMVANLLREAYLQVATRRLAARLLGESKARHGPGGEWPTFSAPTRTPTDVTPHPRSRRTLGTIR